MQIPGRRRWIVVVTVAEAFGYLVPACAGIAAVQAGVGDYPRAALLAGAGFFEGFALGLGQAWAWPLPVRRARYAVLSGLGAAAIWAAAMTLVLVFKQQAEPSWLTIASAALVGALTLCVLGAAQWIELRHYTSTASHWIAWTALAWLLALPFSFAPSPFVDESTPLAAHVVLWSSAGALMAFVMAIVTWSGVRRIAAHATAARSPELRGAP